MDCNVKHKISVYLTEEQLNKRIAEIVSPCAPMMQKNSCLGIF